jgi:hypothetical protein
MPKDPKTLTNEEIIAELIDDKSTPIIIQKEAGDRLAKLTSTAPLFFELTDEQKAENQKREEQQNAPKEYSKIQLLSVPSGYQKDYPELFELLDKKGNSKDDDTVEININRQKITSNNLISEEDMKAAKYSALTVNERINREYKLQLFTPTETPDNFEDLHFPVKLVFDDKISLHFRYYDNSGEVGQYLFVK